MDRPSEQELVAACQGGDRGAYATLVDRCALQVFAVCLGMLGNVHDAEDVAQEALLRGFVGIEKLRDPEQFRTWITRIARNLCMDLLRRRKLGREALARRAERDRTGSPDDPDLQAAIFRLPEKYRVPLMLYYLDGQSTESVAQALDLSPAGLATRLSRARKELRRLLSEQEGER